VTKAIARIACFAAVVCASLSCTSVSLAGDYYIYSCSVYGNTAPAFTSWTDSDHMNNSDECMQPAPGGGYRSLEINNSSGSLVYQGKSAHWIANSPSPEISIVGAYTPPDAVLVDCNLNSDGFSAQYFWGGGAQTIYYLSQFGCNTQGYGYGTGINQSFAPSSYFGWGVTCSYATTCSSSSIIGSLLGVNGIQLTAEENSGPGILADGSNNLWYQGSHWVRGGGWPVGFTASDPSGVCGTDLLINGQFTTIDNTEDTSPDTSSFTQCWASDVVTGTLDTDSFANGPLTIEYAANNAAAVVSGPTETLQVDNTPVTLSLSTPNDSDPDVWVNHAVQVIATASAGPSGLAGTTCSTNNGPTYPYPAGGVTLDGTGVWNLSCSSWNNAYDVNGLPATSGPQTLAVHIDETPPSISFESTSPSDPQALVADTSDAQSGVATGQIAMRPAGGGSWSSLATTFDGSHLRARFNDAALPAGQWVVQATSCDNAGNCASTQETIRLPMRIGSVSSAGFEKDKAARGKATDCSHHRTHRRRHRRRCHAPKLILTSEKWIGFGERARLHGLLMTATGAPIAGARVSILTAAANGLSGYSQIASATTASDGTWAAELPPGPSRLIEAVYSGSPTIEPSTSWAKLVVPASVRVLRVWPRHVPWGGKVHIKAQLLGGYLPAEGALVRLRLGYGKSKITYGVQEHVGGNGVFEVTNSFGPGPARLVLHYWLQECTLPEGDYPYAPACGPRDHVTVGGS